jgi:hypothetical protein
MYLNCCEVIHKISRVSFLIEWENRKCYNHKYVMVVEQVSLMILERYERIASPVCRIAGL